MNRKLVRRMLALISRLQEEGVIDAKEADAMRLQAVFEIAEGGEMEPNFDVNDKNVLVAEIRLSEGMTPSEAKTLIQENLSQSSSSNKLSVESIETRQEFWNRYGSKTEAH